MKKKIIEYVQILRGELINRFTVLTDGKLNSHKEYHRYMQACSTMQSK